MLVPEVFEQVQARLEKTQVTGVGAMDDFDPVVPLGDHAHVDDPDYRPGKL